MEDLGITLQNNFSCSARPRHTHAVYMHAMLAGGRRIATTLRISDTHIEGSCVAESGIWGVGSPDQYRLPNVFLARSLDSETMDATHSLLQWASRI